MIPKVIHFCWFGGGEYPAIVEKCQRSCKKYCPDYKIIIWDENTYDVKKNKYVREAYERKKWAFVSDYARLDIIYNYGGIYLDTDVELVKSLDGLLGYSCFVASDGEGINTGLGFAAEAHNPIIMELLKEYENKDFIVDGVPDLTPCTIPNTKIFKKLGCQMDCNYIQIIQNTAVLPKDFFSPIDGDKSVLNITDNTIGIHWGTRLWETGLEKIKASIRIKFGLEVTGKIKELIQRFNKVLGLKK